MELTGDSHSPQHQEAVFRSHSGEDLEVSITVEGLILTLVEDVALGNKKEHKEHGGSLELNPTDGLVDRDSQKLNECRLPPLVSALKASAEENAASFHFPGQNRGQAAPSSLTRLIGARPFLHDLPELPELDNPFAPLPRDLFWKRKNRQLSFSGHQRHGFLLVAVHVEEAIKELETEGLKPAAVFVVSPSYHGVCSGIGAISELCHKNDIPVIVDEAHGAHFGFHDHLPASALAQAADIVVQSTHKVLCSLTQSSMLHLSSNLIHRERICRCLQMLQSSSPSYLLLASLDAATAQLSDSKGTIFNEAIELAVETRRVIKHIHGISLFDTANFPSSPAIDPLRITVGARELGLSGFEADDILCRDFGVASELVGTPSITLAFNLGTKREHASRLLSGLEYLSETSPHTNGLSAEKEANATALAPFDDFNVVLSPRDAFFARNRKVSFEDNLGKICGELICPYPPGIPVVIPGEVVTERALKYLLHVKSKGATISGAADRRK
ncbi:hypothetical protein SASPL_153655 [Salvia splendens]|uniref:Arginine decarboxylase n=1 Tax=Salvia splendens TaxID=180675 RepID=A0A8X8YXT0_SALSN|nr:hypothetical protein SASPL_153655 [Salvia splendens]